MMNAIARFNPSRVFHLLTSSLLLAVTLSVQAQEQDLILKTGDGSEAEQTEIPLTGTLKLDDQGRVIAIPVDPEACQATSSCEDVKVELTTFSANNEESSLTIDQGKSIAFRWSSRGAYACEATGDLPNWSAGTTKPQFATGSQETVSTDSTDEGTYTAGLRCTNGSVTSATLDVDITVNVSDDPEPEPTNCPSDRQPPANWSRVSTCRYNDNSDCTDMGAIFGGDGNIMNLNLGNPKPLVLNTNSDREYWAMKFNTDGMSSTLYRRFDIANPQNVISGYGNGRKIITISECPGDFNRSAIPSGCYDSMTGGLFTFGGSSSAMCQLDPDTTYYFNVLYSSSPDGTSPDSLQPSTCADGEPGCGNMWNPQ